eukprot:5017754-Amphidinium_carterae.1
MKNKEQSNLSCRPEQHRQHLKIMKLTNELGQQKNGLSIKRKPQNRPSQPRVRQRFAVLTHPRKDALKEGAA